MTIIATFLFLASLNPNQAMVIGLKVWQNECGSTLDGLTSWNEGEEFASIGIGHFIWYPHNKKKQFEETFPELVHFLIENGVDVPRWIEESLGCPWKTREEFKRAVQQQMKQIIELRRLMQKTIVLQTQFLSLRLEKALPALLAKSSDENREKIKTAYERLQNHPNGLYVLLDYVNFKGYGTSDKEAYGGAGWGLYQVLERMPNRADANPIAEFVKAAKELLEERVKNSPAERNENKYLQGWLNRLDSYFINVLSR
jgi:hypothetical protein